MNARAVGAWAMLALVVSLGVATVLLNTGAGEYAVEWGETALFATVTLASAAVGLLLALRRPSNPIGWVLLTLGLALIVSGFAESYAGYAWAHGGDYAGARLAAVWYTAGWPALFAPIVALALIFPDGRLPSRLRRVAVGGALCFLVVLCSGMLWDDPPDEPFEFVEPYGVVSTGTLEPIHGLALLGMIVTFVVAMATLVRRFRAADGIERLQLKWVAYAGTLLPISIVAGTIDGVLFDSGPGPLTAIPFALMLIAIPASIGVAVLRYRLYEIDRLISATLVYGVLTATLAAAFAAVSLGLGVALGGGSALPTAAATLAVVVAFRPLRDRVQRAVDRRFNRSRYEGLMRVDAFLDDLRGGRAEPEGVGEMLAEATADPSLRLYFWLPHEETHADARGRVLAELPTEPSGRTPVGRGELRLGTVVHDPVLGERGGLLDSVIVRAGLAIEIARLRVEVRRQLAEVEQSRARIVAATHEERRRLERDIHDGAQQRLVTLGLEIRHLQQGLDSSAEDTRTGLNSVVAGLTDAIGQLRELAHGVRPATLDGGLGPALRELASRTPIRTELEVTDERFDEQIETAAYFVATEALTNAVKHANPTSVAVQARRSNGKLVISVHDDGRGGATPSGGSGLTGLTDRVAALGGRLELASDRGAGTTLRAEFPCD